MIKDKIKRKGQALLEFGITLPIILMIFLGTIDIFNIAISYVEMTFLGNTFLNSTMINAKGFETYRAMEIKAHNLMQNHRNIDERTKSQFPAYFSFKPSDMQMKRDSGGSNANDIGVVKCYMLRKEVNMLVGRLFVGENKIHINKRVCGIQERKIEP